jgi:hypothetical protein
MSVLVTGDLEALRKENGVRLVNDEEDGTGVHRLPAGVFGYTYAVGMKDAPLFKKNAIDSFEMHKRIDAEVMLVGYLPDDVVQTLETASDLVDLQLYPVAKGTATRLVTIPMSRVVRMKEHSTRVDGSVALRVSLGE